MNDSDIVCEIIENEVIIANIKTGNYYSINGIGKNIWQLIQIGLQNEEISAKLAEHYPTKNTEEIKTTINNFINKLQEEELILSPKNYQYDKDLHTDIINNLPANFSNPELEKFTDMQALLQLDPIHEVNITDGWPNKSES